MKNELKNALSFFCNNTKYSEVKKIKKINLGFTNLIYMLKTNDSELYKVRLANKNNYINRELEKYLEETYNSKDILYYEDNGNYIKKWLNWHCLTKKKLSENFWEECILFLEKLQSTSITKSINITYPKYYDDDDLCVLNDNLKDEFIAYKNMVDELNKNEFVISHNDFSCSNIIIDNKNQIHVFDFEWASFNHKYWDISNLIKDLELNYDDVINNVVLVNKYDKNLLIKIIFLVHFYTYIWTYRMPETIKLLKYRKHIIKRIRYWFHKI